MPVNVTGMQHLGWVMILNMITMCCRNTIFDLFYRRKEQVGILLFSPQNTGYGIGIMNIPSSMKCGALILAYPDEWVGPKVYFYLNAISLLILKYVAVDGVTP